MQQVGTRELEQGFGDALAAAFELAVTPAIFGFLGWLIDRQVNLFPVFTISFTLVTAGYATWKLYRSYSDRMDVATAERRAAWLAGAENV
ncbi:MAG: AtpZ/AtpI family protein [Acidimicrobiales bacterium]|jgi:F0F1-type ATP synthase assembly protein I|nr:AtpZ/AtpI family protein [Acidimicrobiales bacterium]